MDNEDKMLKLLEQMDGRLDRIESDVATLKDDMISVKGDVSALKNDMVSVKSYVSALKNDMVSVKSDVSTLNDNMTVVKEDIVDLKGGQARIESKLDAVYNQTADLSEFRTETRQGISDIKDTMRFILHKEIETEKEIFKLKEKVSQIKDVSKLSTS